MYYERRILDVKYMFMFMKNIVVNCVSVELELLIKVLFGRFFKQKTLSQPNKTRTKCV